MTFWNDVRLAARLLLKDHWFTLPSILALALGIGANTIVFTIVNAVVIRGINDHEIESLADFGRERGLSMRFIEFMPLDSARAWLK